jgi:NAD(P)-dependent dehydrogenase (short-subunit alcohol dehydrogenase family)
LRAWSSEEWFSGTVVAVTGGARGIGAATVSAFSKAGARVASLDVDPDGTSGASGSTLFERCDVSSPAEVAKAFSTVEAELGPVDVLVNNAGVNARFDPVSMSPDEWDAFFAVDLRSMWLCARAVLPRMRERGGGAIVNVASIQATLTQAGAFPYAAAKAGVLGLTTSLALEEGPFGIRVNAVSPGYTRTRLVVDALQATGNSDAAEREIAAKHALGRIAEPEEVANMILVLASPFASFVTGANVAVDGGLGCRYA